MTTTVKTFELSEQEITELKACTFFGGDKWAKHEGGREP